MRGGSATRSNPLPFYITVLTEMVHLPYTFYWHMVPLSHTFRTLHPFQLLSMHCRLNMNKMNRHKTGTFSQLFHSHKMHLWALLAGPFYKRRSGNFPSLLKYILTSESSTLAIPEAWKGYPFWAEPPRIGHYKEYPLGFSSKGSGRKLRTLSSRNLLLRVN